MPKYTTGRGSPLQVAGHDKPITVTGDHFWGWEYQAKMARECVRNDPTKALEILGELATEMAKCHALSRHDDPFLPAYYRSLLSSSTNSPVDDDEPTPDSAG